MTVATTPATGGRLRRVDRRRALQRRRAHRRGAAVLLALVVLVASDLPRAATGVACEVPGEHEAVIHRASLATDGEVEEVRELRVDDAGATCDEGVADPEQLPVSVAISHRDDRSATVEPTRFDRAEGAVTTHVRVTDSTARERTVTVDGPLGITEETDRIAVPQLVRVAIRYPASWDVQTPSGEGLTTRLDDDGVEVARAALLAAPFGPQQLSLEVRATPGRGTPSVEVDATPVAGREPFVLPDELLDRDAAAVLGALTEVAADGAAELADGADELAEGTGEMADGAEELAANADPLIEGTDELADGSRELATGADGLVEGQRELTRGIEELAGGAGQAATGVEELVGGAAELDAGLGQLEANAAPLADGAAEVAAGARRLADELATVGELGATVTDGVAEARSLVVELEALADRLRELGDAVIAAPIQELTALRDELAAEDPEDPAVVTLATTIALLEELQGVPHALADGADELAAGLAAALDRFAQLGGGLEELAGGADDLATGSEEVAAGAEQLAAALGPVAEGAAGLAAGTAELETALTGLAGGTRELAAGGQELAANGAGLADGLDGLAAGADETADGTRRFGRGVEELADGAGELADGTRELADGSQQLPESLEEAVGVADRRGQRIAADRAVLEEGSELARAAIGGATLATTQLVHAGEEPLPLTALGTAGGLGLAVLGAALSWWWRRSGSGG